MTDINGYGELWPDPFGMDRAPKWVMPWLAPGPIALQALSELGTPLHACQTGDLLRPRRLECRRTLRRGPSETIAT